MPFGVANGLLIYGAGAEDDLGFLLVYVPVVLVVYAILYRKNRQIGRTRYEAEAERLEVVLEDFDRMV